LSSARGRGRGARTTEARSASAALDQREAADSKALDRSRRPPAEDSTGDEGPGEKQERAGDERDAAEDQRPLLRDLTVHVLAHFGKARDERLTLGVKLSGHHLG
jgi:hypothetical protein